jgi:hypothetical protein
VDNRSEGAEIYIDTAEATPNPAPKPAHTEPCTKPTFDVHIAATARSGAGHQAGNSEEGRRIQTKRKKGEKAKEAKIQTETTRHTASTNTSKPAALPKKPSVARRSIQERRPQIQIRVATGED